MRAMAGACGENLEAGDTVATCNRPLLHIGVLHAGARHEHFAAPPDTTTDHDAVGQLRGRVSTRITHRIAPSCEAAEDDGKCG